MQNTQQSIEALSRKLADHELLAELAVEEETRKKNTALASLYRELVATAKALTKPLPPCDR
jgi:hypothetical protein